MLSMNSDVKFVKGVGPKALIELNKIGVFTVLDLLLYFPRDYEGVRFISDIKSCNDKEKVFIYGIVKKINRDIRTSTGKLLSTIVFENNEGTFKGIWFNQSYIKNSFKEGTKYLLSGTCKIEGKNITIQNPKIIRNSTQDKEKIIAKYPLKGKITNNFLNKIITNLLCNVKIEENLPKDIVNKYRLMDLNSSINHIHCPDNMESLNQARRRLKFQELFTYSLKMLSLKERYEKAEGFSIPISNELVELKEKLPFELTKAQSRVVREILIDQRSNLSMNRLVQGDVGSGKTIVAIIAMFNAVKASYQSLMMAPTEILAKQHFKEISNVLEGFNIKVELLVGSTTLKNKKRIKEELNNGEIDIIVGTHALIEEDVQFKKLGLIITDEQHRFGVNQRCRLSNKSKNADVLVMTATPIPRTLSLCFYGDLEQSIIDELPPNRKKIETYYLKKSEKSRAYNFALKEIKSGRQIYIVCPLVEENDKMDLSSVEALYDELKDEYFKSSEVKILHGKMPWKEKEEIMESFKSGYVKVLISTTVIEVGVNVPNATVMIIENAERFGLAQLHQLRGRVGRGSHKSYCILLPEIKSDHTRKRMEIMQNISDGFILAEEDLKLRGAGELFGYRQHGDSELIIADPVEDVKILKVANDEAKRILCSKDKNYNEFKNYIKENIKNSSNYICFN